MNAQDEGMPQKDRDTRIWTVQASKQLKQDDDEEEEKWKDKTTKTVYVQRFRKLSNPKLQIAEMKDKNGFRNKWCMPLKLCWNPNYNVTHILWATTVFNNK